MTITITFTSLLWVLAIILSVLGIGFFGYRAFISLIYTGGDGWYTPRTTLFDVIFNACLTLICLLLFGYSFMSLFS